LVPSSQQRRPVTLAKDGVTEKGSSPGRQHLQTIAKAVKAMIKKKALDIKKLRRQLAVAEIKKSKDEIVNTVPSLFRLIHQIHR